MRIYWAKQRASLPVLITFSATSHSKLVGIVTRADLVSAFSRPDEEIALDIRDDVLLGAFWSPQEMWTSPSATERSP
jgi:CBS domain-containing protein